jgi:hypothetical protein
MNVFFILVTLIIVIGGIITLIRIRLHKKPKEVKLYKLKVTDLIAKLYLSVPFLILAIIISGSLIQKIVIESFYYSFALILPILLGFLSIPSLVLFKQYYNVEKDRLIELHPDNRQMRIKTKNEEIQSN